MKGLWAPVYLFCVRYTAKMLARVELQRSPDVAVGFQKQIRSRSLGKPDFPSVVDIPNFDNQSLIGVEIFEHADAILTSAIDVSPKAAQMQAKVRAVAREVKDGKSRDAIDELLREQVIPEFRQFSVTESGATKNNWLGTLVVGNYGDDYSIPHRLKADIRISRPKDRCWPKCEYSLLNVNVALCVHCCPPDHTRER